MEKVARFLVDAVAHVTFTGKEPGHSIFLDGHQLTRMRSDFILPTVSVCHAKMNGRCAETHAVDEIEVDFCGIVVAHDLDSVVLEGPSGWFWEDGLQPANL